MSLPESKYTNNAPTPQPKQPLGGVVPTETQEDDFLKGSCPYKGGDETCESVPMTNYYGGKH